MAEIHVIPFGDLVGHERGEDCACGPTPNFVMGGVVYVLHHSLDGREVRDRG